MEQDAPPCKLIVSDYFASKTNESRACKMSIIMKYFAMHTDLFDSAKMERKCSQNCITAELEIRDPIYLPPPTNEHVPIFSHIAYNRMKLSRLTLAGSSITPELERGGADTTGIKNLLKWNEASEIVMENIKSQDVAIVEGQYFIDERKKNIHVRDCVLKTESLILDGTSYAGIRRLGIDLNNVYKFDMKNIDFGNKPIETEAIVIRWKNDECPTRELKYHIGSLSGLGSIGQGPISFENKCKPANKSPKLKLKLSILDNSFWPNIPKRVFGPLLDNIDIHRNNTQLTFAFEQIDCCLDDNKWLFELKDKQNETNYDYLVACKDIGHLVANYSLWTLRKNCENRNVVPIYMIALVSGSLLALLILSLGFICCFYVLPKSHRNAIHMKSETGRLEDTGSAGSKSASTGSRKQGKNDDSPGGVVTIRSNQSRVPRASLPSDIVANSSPNPRSANTFHMSHALPQAAGPVLSGKASKVSPTTNYKQVKYSSVIPRKMFVEPKAAASKVGAASKQAKKVGAPLLGAKKTSKAGSRSRSNSKKKGDKNKDAIKAIGSKNPSVRTMQTIVSPQAPAIVSNQPAKNAETFKTLGLSKDTSKGAKGTGGAKTTTSGEGKSDRMSSVFQTIS